MHKLLIIVGICISYPAWAVLPVNDNNSNVYTQLQLQKSKSDMQLEIARLKLEHLKIQSEIDKLNGVAKEQQPSAVINVLEISEFNNKHQAVIDINGNTKTYKVGENLSKDLVLTQISQKSIEVLNKVTNQSQLYFMA
ncbi:hypothetical protein [Francisella sp. TX07-6608]|uniref:hypothetical protein n=1 Tax=Francisella sp. TX07-6608 TaxID=573568 RepID=UPI0008F9DE8A|nr:hypothetical protein [Francisella sp. TX07-6608]OIN82906.1 hypothetical protein KX00_2041 [Francisella sp. TX07-6608]